MEDKVGKITEEDDRTEEEKMNDKELLENIVNQLISLEPSKWTKRYAKEEGKTERKTYITIIENYDIYPIDIHLIHAIYLYSPIISLLMGKHYYALNIYSGLIDMKNYEGKQYRAKIRELYQAIEEKVGKITEEDDRTEEKNKKLLTDLEKSLKNHKKLRIIK